MGRLNYKVAYESYNSHGGLPPVSPQTPLDSARTLRLQQAEHVATHGVLEDVQRRQAALLDLSDVPAPGLGHQAVEDGVVRHEHEQGDAGTEDVAGEEALSGLVSTEHPTPTTTAAAAAAVAPVAVAFAVAFVPRHGWFYHVLVGMGGRGAVASLPALGGLVAGGGVALKVSGLHGGHVLGEAEVAKTGKLAVLAQEDVLELESSESKPAPSTKRPPTPRRRGPRTLVKGFVFL